MTPEAVMRKVTSGFAANDLRPLMDVVDDNTVWRSAARSLGPFKFGGEYRSRAGVAEVTSNIFSSYTFHRFMPKEIVTSREIVWGIFDVECSYHPDKDKSKPAKPVRYECALRWRVSNGMLVEYQAFFDTASLLYQQGEILLPSRET
jgi:ketosteroid isomerase-like protein